jgi:hypothetical protein
MWFMNAEVREVWGKGTGIHEAQAHLAKRAPRFSCKPTTTSLLFFFSSINLNDSTTTYPFFYLFN